MPRVRAPRMAEVGRATSFLPVRRWSRERNRAPPPWSVRAILGWTARAREGSKDMRRLLVMSVVFLGTIAVFSPQAAATAPTVQSVEFFFEGTTSDFCSFPLSLMTHLEGTRIRFFDESGALDRAVFSLKEQDTISANGKSLTSDLYHFSLQIDYENGEVISFVTYGLGGKFLLPDGTLFLSAGVIDFTAQGVDFSITPDVGVTGDIDALCAALSP